MKTPKYLWILMTVLALGANSTLAQTAPSPKPRLPQRPTSQLPPRPGPQPTQQVQSSPRPYPAPSAQPDTEPTKLFVYTQNGFGTTRTTTGGEFGSQLSTSASIGGPFTFRWTREKASGTAKTGILNVYDASGSRVGSPNVSIPAQKTMVDISFTFPANAKPGDYTASVGAGETGSSKVTLKYTGPGAGSNVVVSTPTPGPVAPAPAETKITLKRFIPMKGFPKTAGYKPAHLYITIEAPTATTIKQLYFEVYSEPFTNPSSITAGSSTHSPIKLMSGRWGPWKPGYTVTPGMPVKTKIDLKATTDYTKETGAVSSPEDWGIAYSKTQTASFRWSRDDTLIGTVEKPLHAPWY